MPRLFRPEDLPFLATTDQETADWAADWAANVDGCVLTEAKTLGEAILAYEKAFSVSITPYDGSDPEYPIASDEEPKYFRIDENGSDVSLIVDIHIYRKGKKGRICPKQSLDYPLEPDDCLVFGDYLFC